jgi:type IV pilus assembly protein PilX
MNTRGQTAIGPARQAGVVLFVALILLLILSLLGVTAARMQTSEERMARNEDNHQIGAQAAEAALRFGESGIATGAPGMTFPSTNPGMLAPTSWNVDPMSLVNWSAPATVIAYAGPPLTSLPAASQSPELVIELLPAVSGKGGSLAVTSLTGNSQPATVYRLTAQGVGADGTSTTMLQSIYETSP